VPGSWTETGREDTFDHGRGIGKEIGRGRRNLFVPRRVWPLFLLVNGRGMHPSGNREVAVAVAVGEEAGEEEVRGDELLYLLNFGVE
jgi:hypothetical protein